MKRFEEYREFAGIIGIIVIMFITAFLVACVGAERLAYLDSAPEVPTKTATIVSPPFMKLIQEDDSWALWHDSARDRYCYVLEKRWQGYGIGIDCFDAEDSE